MRKERTINQLTGRTDAIALEHPELWRQAQQEGRARYMGVPPQQWVERRYRELGGTWRTVRRHT